MTSFNHMNCLITGAASGIGKATAFAAAAEGANLYLTDINEVQLKVVVDEIKAKGGKVCYSRAFDIADFDSVRDFAQQIHSHYGTMDMIMNIAGIAVWGSIENLQHSHWKKVIDVNLMGPIHVLESFVPEMIQAGRGGHLVNVSSAAGLFGLPWHAAYSASKFGVRGISEVLRFDLRRYGIRVSLICPGAVHTGLVNTLEVIGVNMETKAAKALKAHFERHAITPEKAATRILKGIKNNQYMVFTSIDIQVGYWFQRKFSLPYEYVMARLNDRMYAVIEARKTTSSRPSSDAA
jgi:NAD(P)-dependent dehydrogenase (short-subunit alcohol dehydrogenase family)